jgi:hypothetical protein
MFEKLKCISFELSRNPHKPFYDTIDDYIDSEYVDILPQDVLEIIEKQEIWELMWYPDTPVGHCTIAAATFERIQQLVDEMTKEQ